MEYLSVCVGAGRSLVMWLPDNGASVRVRTVPQLTVLSLWQLKDWSGRVVTPEDGEQFLAAAFDSFLLRGLDPQWVYVGRCGLEWPDFLESEV